MEKVCILRIEFNGNLYRVERVFKNDLGTLARYRVMNKRRMVGGLWYSSEKLAVEAALAAAFGCGVDVCCGTIL